MYKKRISNTVGMVLLVLCVPISMHAQNSIHNPPGESNQLKAPPNVADTIQLTLNEAEAYFVKNNYTLLAAKYNVDAQYALVTQARLFNNPEISYDNMVYNKYMTHGRKWFPTALGAGGDQTVQGDFNVQLSWLFSVAGKRIKTANVASLQADVAKYQFDDLMRGLLFALRQDFIDLYFGLKSLQLFDEQIAVVNNIVAGFEVQFKNGHVSLRDITRVRALLLSLRSDRMDLYTSLQENSAKEFSILLNNGKNIYYKPVLNEAEFDSKYNLSKVALADLVNQALQNRPDLKAGSTQVASDEANLKLQKAIAIPDITIDGSIARNSDVLPNQKNLGIGIPLPIFNRNQGNIKSAKLVLTSSRELVKSDQIRVQNDVYSSYQKILELQKSEDPHPHVFMADFRSVLKGAEDNFAKKNLSLLEFVDMFESYKNYMTQSYGLKNQRYSAFEELNLHVGIDVFK